MLLNGDSIKNGVEPALTAKQDVAFPRENVPDGQGTGQDVAAKAPPKQPSTMVK
jgi:hypothetical protein